jgi:hypothetical protein
MVFLPEGAAFTRDGTVYHNVEEMYYQAECALCLHEWLDEQGVPRADTEGEVYSLVGRVMRYKEQ